MNFYKSTKWKMKRANVLRRDEYLCRQCKRYGKTTAAQTVHHIFPLKDYPDYKLMSANLYSCCNTCHNSFHDRNTNELTSEGMKLLERLKKDIIK